MKPVPPSPLAIDRAWALRGMAFAGLQWGELDGSPIVLLHGFLDHAGGWEFVARRLGLGCVALDLRGHGHSAWVGPAESYHFADYLADLDALVDQLGGSVRLVGHSMGGTLASLYAGARPERVQRVALLDGLGLPDGGQGARSRMVEFLDAAGAPRTQRTMASVGDAADRLQGAWPTLDRESALHLARRGTRSVPDGVAWGYDPRHRSRSAVPYRQDQHRQFLEAITCPVLSLHPEHSPFHPEDVARLEAGIRQLRVEVIAGAGHMLPLDAPEAVATALRGFLSAG